MTLGTHSGSSQLRPQSWPRQSGSHSRVGFVLKPFTSLPCWRCWTEKVCPACPEYKSTGFIRYLASYQITVIVIIDNLLILHPSHQSAVSMRQNFRLNPQALLALSFPCKTKQWRRHLPLHKCNHGRFERTKRHPGLPSQAFLQAESTGENKALPRAPVTHLVTLVITCLIRHDWNALQEPSWRFVNYLWPSVCMNDKTLGKLQNAHSEPFPWPG